MARKTELHHGVSLPGQVPEDNRGLKRNTAGIIDSPDTELLPLYPNHRIQKNAGLATCLGS